MPGTSPSPRSPHPSELQFLVGSGDRTVRVLSVLEGDIDKASKRNGSFTCLLGTLSFYGNGDDRTAQDPGCAAIKQFLQCLLCSTRTGPQNPVKSREHDDKHL